MCAVVRMPCSLEHCPESAMCAMVRMPCSLVRMAMFSHKIPFVRWCGCHVLWFGTPLSPLIVLNKAHEKACCLFSGWCLSFLRMQLSLKTCHEHENHRNQGWETKATDGSRPTPSLKRIFWSNRSSCSKPSSCPGVVRSGQDGIRAILNSFLLPIAHRFVFLPVVVGSQS